MQFETVVYGIHLRPYVAQAVLRKLESLTCYKISHRSSTVESVGELLNIQDILCQVLLFCWHFQGSNVLGTNMHEASQISHAVHGAGT